VSDRRIPDATVVRLPSYLQVLVDLADRGVRTVSSDGLAEAAGVGSAQVRKDLSHLGSYGTRGVGYDVTDLLNHVSSVLGLTRERRVVIVGAGNLGRALASYRGFPTRGFQVVALVDRDPAVVGQRVAGTVVASLDDLPALVARERADIAIVATPASAAQEVTDRLVAAGVTAILNFAPQRIDTPRGVTVRKVDLSTELQLLAYYERVSDSEGSEQSRGHEARLA